MDRQRIDKWLWHVRVVRTRTAAAALVNAGMIRVNATRIDAPSRPVRPGDVVTVSLDRGVRVLKVVGYADRRGSAEAVRGLYEDLTPPPSLEASPESPALREEGAGRPTKRERRQIDRLRGREDLDSG